MDATVRLRRIDSGVWMNASIEIVPWADASDSRGASQRHQFRQNHLLGVSDGETF